MKLTAPLKPEARFRFKNTNDPEISRNLFAAQKERVNPLLLGNEKSTYSKYFYRKYDYDGKLLFKKYIPSLSDKTVVQLLKQVRSAIFRELYVNLNSNQSVQLPDDTLSDWPKSVVANVLLGPYIYGVVFSGNKYVTNEDQFEIVQDTLPEGIAVNVVPETEQLPGVTIQYELQKIALSDNNTNTSTTIIYNYPSERAIVRYLRSQRALQEVTATGTLSTEFVLYHNLLVKYIF